MFSGQAAGPGGYKMSTLILPMFGYSISISTGAGFIQHDN
jgi:hypothetical protein